jgi:hypothetical protein
MADEPIYRDQKGVRICEGDLLRSYHFTGSRKKKHYLYHGIVRNNKYGVLEMVPVAELCGSKPDGGRCWLLAIVKNGYADAEIIHGRSYENRLRDKQPPPTEVGE